MKIINGIAFGLITTLLLTNCSKQQGNESDKTIFRPDTENFKGEKYQLDTLNSVITWIGSKPTGQHNGTINIDSGTIYTSEGNIISGQIYIDIKSIDIKDLKKQPEKFDKLKKHLISEDFFAADSFPVGIFEISQIIPFDSSIQINSKEEFESDYMPASNQEFMIKHPTHFIYGNLELKGITRSIEFPAIVTLKNNTIKAEGKFNIDRTRWNISYQDEASVLDKLKDKFIYNTVNVGFSIEASLQD